MENKIKLVCSDIDGTLVAEGTGNLNPAYYEEIRRLKEKGIRFAVVSGRSYESTRPLFAPVVDDLIFINDNGAVSWYHDQIIKSHFIDYDLAVEIAADVENCPGCTAYISGIKKSYAWAKKKEFCDMLRTSYKLDVQELERMPEDLPRDAGVLCMALYHPTDAEKAAGKGFLEKWSNHPQVETMCAGNMWLNICQRKVNKGTALLELIDSLGIKKEEVMAFGDNMNDYGMLSAIPNSVAIGSARQEIKDICSMVADTQENDGVLKVLRTL